MFKFEELLNGSNFAKSSDFIFSEIVSYQEFLKLKSINKKLIIFQEYNQEKFNAVWYINPLIKISDNHVIFCHTELVELLFQLIKGTSVKNLKLITHMSDRSIDRKLYFKKPTAISEWYGVNVVYKCKNLHSIPLGINNLYNLKNINKEILIRYFLGNFTEFKNKKNIIYSNFNPETNRKHRYSALEKTKNVKKLLRDSNKSLEEYYSNLSEYKFIFCPWGNGIDTHRFWEALYLNSVPITKFHEMYQSFKEFPKILVDDYKNLESFIDDYNHKNLQIEALKIDYWMKRINKLKIPSGSTLFLDLSKQIHKRIRFILIYRKFKSIYKKIIFYVYKFFKS